MYTSKHDISDSEKLIQLFNISFPGEEKLSIEYLNWLYYLNPLGNVIANNMLNEGEIISHYAVVPTLVVLDKKVKVILLSLNTATNSNYQGKGLFKKLATKTYDDSSSMGYSEVLGVANKNSSFAFINRLGFSQQGSVKIYLCFSFYKKFILEDVFNLDVYQVKYLNWKLSNPSSEYFYFIFKNSYLFFTKKKNVYFYLGFKSKSNFDASKVTQLQYMPMFYLIPYHGKSKTFLPYIPKWIKPSPWNIIIKFLGNNKIDEIANVNSLEITAFNMDAF